MVSTEANPSLMEIHSRLANWNRQRLVPTIPDAVDNAELHREFHMRSLELAWIERLRAEAVAHTRSVPRDYEGFSAWFLDLEKSGPGQHDPLFAWLAEEAGADDLRWFFEQEAAGEAGFDDLLAATLIKMQPEAKLGLARNFWDEMGRGNASGMHGPLLSRGLQELALDPSIAATVWPSLALANTMTAFATHRRYAYHAIGALGVVELTAPGRVAQVARGMARVGFPPIARKYFELHAVLDVKHAEDWMVQIFKPLIESDSAVVPSLAEGAWMRLECGRRCFEAYRAVLWDRNALAAE